MRAVSRRKHPPAPTHAAADQEFSGPAKKAWDDAIMAYADDLYAETCRIELANNGPGQARQITSGMVEDANALVRRQRARGKKAPRLIISGFATGSGIVTGVATQYLPHPLAIVIVSIFSVLTVVFTLSLLLVEG